MKMKVKCPICKKRAFDAEYYTKGEIEIKCHHCKNIVTITLDFTKNY